MFYLPEARSAKENRSTQRSSLGAAAQPLSGVPLYILQTKRERLAGSATLHDDVRRLQSLQGKFGVYR